MIPAQSFINSGFQQIKIGDIERVILTDEVFDLPTVKPVMATEAKVENVNKILLYNYLFLHQLDLAVNIFLLKKDNHLILFDTRTGVVEGNNRKLIDALAKVEI